MKTNIITGRINVKNNPDWNLILRPVGDALGMIAFAIAAIIIVGVSIFCGVICAPISLVIMVIERIKDVYHTISKKIRR